jgi:hypothetical protein
LKARRERIREYIEWTLCLEGRDIKKEFLNEKAHLHSNGKMPWSVAAVISGYYRWGLGTVASLFSLLPSICMGQASRKDATQALLPHLLPPLSKPSEPQEAASTQHLQAESWEESKERGTSQLSPTGSHSVSSWG